MSWGNCAPVGLASIRSANAKKRNWLDVSGAQVGYVAFYPVMLSG